VSHTASKHRLNIKNWNIRCIGHNKKCKRYLCTIHSHYIRDIWLCLLCCYPLRSRCSEEMTTSKWTEERQLVHPRRQRWSLRVPKVCFYKFVLCCVYLIFCFVFNWWLLFVSMMSHDVAKTILRVLNLSIRILWCMILGCSCISTQ